ncbi:hypothetical protein BX661DRAFT_186692, partial [Kickxella alabastrina]
MIIVEHIEKYHWSQHFKHELHHPPPDDVDGRAEWEVEQILDVHHVDNKGGFLGKWVGYNEDDSTWEPGE